MFDVDWSDTHANLLASAFEKVLGQRPNDGAMAFTRCLASDVLTHLEADGNFAPEGWDVYRVSDEAGSRTITADKAVEWREDKRPATLLLVDTATAGAGMDGIYSASKEVDETSLFKVACQLARAEITRQASRTNREYAERAVREARRTASRQVIPPWVEFDFLVQVAASKLHPGAHLHRLGLWPVAESNDSDSEEDLATSRKLVDRLLGPGAAGRSIPMRIDSLQLDGIEAGGRVDLERFLQEADPLPLTQAMARLADRRSLWVGVIKVPSAEIREVSLAPWRSTTGSLFRWSGLVEYDDRGPRFVLKTHAEDSGDYSTLEVRWKATPPGVAKGTVDYRVAVLTKNMEEELAAQDVSHSARATGEKCRFSNDDFDDLEEDSSISAKVVISVIGNDEIDKQESEEFLIHYGNPPPQSSGGAGRKVRSFSEGLIDLQDRAEASAVVDDASHWEFDEKRSTALLRTRGTRRLSYQVPCPPLIREIERQWMDERGTPGRWRIRVREAGTRDGPVEFVPANNIDSAAWRRVERTSRSLVERIRISGSIVGQLYDERAKSFGLVKDHLLAWAASLESSNPLLSLCNTVEVRSLSGKVIGLIVLPMHPLRIAWHAAYDNLVLHAASEQEQKAKDVRNELKCLDGAMFPAFLPHPEGNAFVFADTLGFHAVGMVPDTDKEPKAAMAILARALGDDAVQENAPTVGGQSAKLIGDEIVKYLDCHDVSRLLQVHAIRGGDGLTMAKSLGQVLRQRAPTDADEAQAGDGEDAPSIAPAFSLEMYPSEDQRGIAGRYIAAARERRRSGAGVVDADDRWMLESLSLNGGVTMPRLRWAKKEGPDPDTAAHLAVAFDTFESEVQADMESAGTGGPIRAFGLLSYYDRGFNAAPTPRWRSTVAASSEGEKHPSDRGHTERLDRMQRAVSSAVARHVGQGATPGIPALHTAVPPEKQDELRKLHELCDWVVTLDRNAGVEYFDSPRDNPTIYDAYVIDCVPERGDLGCLQLITSTSNLEEVRTLLDDALDRMGLSRSRRNAEFLLTHLKALSGRLAIRLTGNKPPTSELIALAVAHANCHRTSVADPCWLSLSDGFIVPADDVQDLMPPQRDGTTDERTVRPDLIYVTMAPRKGLQFRFVEIKYRRDLRAARAPDLLRTIERQVGGSRERWAKHYSIDQCSTFRAIRRAKLSRVLRFYADKARRHHLSEERHAELVAEIDRMILRGPGYELGTGDPADLGWVFCPEFAGTSPLRISPDDWDTKVFLFGPGLLPDPGDEHGGDAATAMGEPPDTTDAADESEGGSVQVPDAAPTPSSEGGSPNSGDASETPSVFLGTNAATNADVRWPLTVQGNPHLLIGGLPGMGKTTCLLNVSRQLVEANVSPIIFSYHEDIDERLADSLDDVRFIDFDGLGFNPLHVLDRTNAMAHLDVAGAMRDIFCAVYPDLGDLQADRIRRAIRDSFTEAGWGKDASVADLHEPAFDRFLEILRTDPKPNPSLRSLLTRLDELDDYGFFRSGSAHGSLWEGHQPTVIRIHTTQNQNLQRAFAALVFYGLYKDMFRRGIQSRITHALIFDEAHRASGLELIPTMAKECRKYGISLVLASQEAKDFNVSVFSAIANYLVLRLTEADAKALTRNVADSRQERALIDRIKQMDRFKALYFTEGSRAARVNLAP